MSIKWLSKLSLDELTDLHGAIISPENVDTVYSIKKENDTLLVCFKEYWGEGDSETIAEEKYVLDDFKGETPSYSPFPELDVKEFRKWMINKFGSEYIDDLKSYIVNISIGTTSRDIVNF